MTGLAKKWYQEHPILKLLPVEGQTQRTLWGRRAWVLVAGLILLSSGGWYIGYLEKERPEIRPEMVTPSRIDTSGTPTPKPTQAAVVATEAATVYRLTVKLKAVTEFDPQLWMQELQAANQTLVFHGPFTNTLTAQGLWVVKVGGNWPSGGKWETEKWEISWQKDDEAIKPYLLNRKFCLTQTDCLIRESQCQRNAYNVYELERKFICLTPEPDPTYKCRTQFDYKPPRCEANTCQAEAGGLRCMPEE